MRRPALHRPTRPAAPSAWAHPYPTGLFSPVFYNSGAGEAAPPAAAAAPSPADLAARTAPPAAPAAPGAAAVDPDDEKVTFTQRRLNTIMRDEKEEGRRAALRAFAESAGLDSANLDFEQVGKLVKDAQEAQRQRMSDIERREADAQDAADKAAQQVADAEAKVRAAQELARDAQQRIALTGLGVRPDDLADVAALLRNDLTNAGITEPTEDQISEAAAKLKERRPGDFGAPATPQTLPPAPGGAPAGGPPQRTPAGSKDAVKAAARARAESMGLRNDDAA